MKLFKDPRFYTVFTTIALVLGCAFGAAAQGGGPGFSFGDTSERNEACLSCHGDAGTVPAGALIKRSDYSRTSHAEVGCTSCHGVSAAHPDGAKVPRPNCVECHNEINQEYAQGVHAAKTTCAGCHNPHQVDKLKEISGHEINQMCAGCHDNLEMVAKHGEWLPQSDLHIRMLPCITCHTESQSYFINMHVVKSKDGTRFGKQQLATYEELKQMAPGGNVLALIDSNGDNYVSLTELRNFNTSPDHKALHLQGMMTPSTVSHKFERIDNRRNCTFCHAAGPAAMQTSFLSLPEQNGTFRRVAVEKGAVLDALYGTPDFYMMGSTKNETLNYIGLAVICGGLIMPVGHGSMRFLTRKNRQRKEH